MTKTFYITTPIYYANDKLHIGHSYTSIACDVLARYKRLCGYEVYYLTGADEHGQKVALAAQAKKMDTQAFVDSIFGQVKKLWEALNISYTDFIRTTEERHELVVQEMFKEIYQQGDIYPGNYEGLYCIPCETFWLETQSTDNTCPDCGRPLERLKEETYFFRLSKYQDLLLDYYRAHPDFIRPESRYNEMVSFVRSGLKDISVTRPKNRISWGVTCPFAEEQTIYVWFDALINYVSALGYKQNPQFEKFWPADVHMVGKDIVKFHAVIWPAMLMAAKVPLPQKVFAHGWWTVEKEKMSKSKGNVVDPYEVIATVGVDAYRYFLLREVPFGQDGDFSSSVLHIRYQADLANNVGNLLHRTLSMIEKYFAGVVPQAGSIIHQEILESKVKILLPALGNALDTMSFHQALEKIWDLIIWGNRFIEEKAPWKLAKTDQQELANVLYTLADLLRIVAVCIFPFMPVTSGKMWSQLGLPGQPDQIAIHSLACGQITAGGRIHKGEPLFPRLEEGSKP